MRLKGKVNWRSLVITLSAIVVFVTTYLLILPAITLDKKAAIEQGGIDVAIEQTIDETTEQTAGTVDADAADADEQAAADEAAAADTAKVTEEPAPEPAKKENAAKTEEKAPDSGEVELLTKTKELTADKEKSADFTVSAVVNEADKVPADVTLQATELTKDTEGFDYDKYYKEALKALKKDDSSFKGISMIRFYDISLESETQDESVEPSDKVSVKIEYDKGIEVSDADNIRIVHFGEKKTEVLDTKENKVEANVDDDNKLTEASFETEGFSEYAVVEVETIEKTVITADGKTYKVTVNYGKDAQIPDGAELDVRELKGAEYDAYLKKVADKFDKSVDDLGFTRFFDITIKNGNDEVTIAAPVDVEIQLIDNDLTEDTQVLHFENENKADVVDSTIEGDTVRFKADGFSIYAVMDEMKRLVYKFYNGTTLISEQWIKAADATDGEYLYDPGANAKYGQTFKGWAFNQNETNYDSCMTITELNQDAVSRFADDDFSDGDEIAVYAIFKEAYYLRFINVTDSGDEKVLHTDICEKDLAPQDFPALKSYAELEGGMVFEGWIDKDTGTVYGLDEDTGTIYGVGGNVSVDHHIDLYQKVQGRSWLVFDANAGGPGSGATYTPPQHLKNDETLTVQPEDPTVTGYEFVGWNTAADGSGDWWLEYETETKTETMDNGQVITYETVKKNADGTPVIKTESQFGGTLNSDVTLYAQWKPALSSYYITVWKQKVSDEAGLADSEKSYDYVSSIKVYALTGEEITLPDEYKNYATTTDPESTFYQTYLNTARTDTSAVVAANGSTVLNVRYDLNTYVLTFQVTGSGTNRYNYTQSDNGTWAYIDGTWVELTRTNPVQETQWYFRYVYNLHTSWIGSGDYNLYPDTMTYYKPSGWFASGDYDRSPGSINNNRYEGVRYTRTGNNYTNYSYSRASESATGNLFGIDSNGGYVELNSTTVTTYSYTYTDSDGKTKTYTGPRFTRSQVNNNNTYWTVKTIVALYGHDISDQFPIVGTNGVTYTDDRWDPQNDPDWKEVMVFIDTMPGRNVTFHRSTSTNPQKTIKYFVEALPGTAAADVDDTFEGVNYVLYSDPITPNYYGVTVEDYVNLGGFVKYAVTNENHTILTFRAVTVQGKTTYYYATSSNASENASTVHFYYKRNKHSIDFVSTGEGTTSTTHEVKDNIYYEQSLASYGEDGANYVEPNNGILGYEFEGWYVDEARNTKFDFENETMPDANLVLYAKWSPTRFRVVLVPTKDNANNDEVSFANNQGLTFRLDYNEKISGANITGEAAQRLGYRLEGWYYQPDFDDDTEWSFDTQINRETQGVDMNYQSSEDWINNTYGDNGYRNNIVKGIIKLYAKWVLDFDENLKYIHYEVPEQYVVRDSLGELQTVIPVDTTGYVVDENTSQAAVIKEAPTGYRDGFEFTGWVLVDSEGNEYIQDNGEPLRFDASGSWDDMKDYLETCLYTETLTDDTGMSQTMSYFKLRATFRVKDAEATKVVYKGNGGLTRNNEATVDRAVLTNSNFNLEGDDLFVREGYTQVGWSFTQTMTAAEYAQAIADNTHDGVVNYEALARLGVFELEQEVAADKLYLSENNNWDPLENTLYAIWQRKMPAKFTKLGETDILSQEEPPLAGVTFTLYSSSDCTEDSAIETATSKDDGSVTFYFDKTGTYYMKETTPDGYETNDEVYTISVVSIGEDETGDEYTITGNGNPSRLSNEGGEYQIKNNKVRTSIVLKKTDDQTPATALTGAVFILKMRNESGSYELVDTVTVDDEDGVTVNNLAPGAYQLTETSAPDGYIIASNTIEFTLGFSGEMTVITDLNADNATSANQTETEDASITVLNTAGTPLPLTGGIGTTIFYILGSMLVVGCGVMLVARRRMRIHK